MLAEVPMAIGLQWRGGGEFLFQEKSDGVWGIFDLRFTIYELRVNLEIMPGGELVVNDLVSVSDHSAVVSCLDWPTRKRWKTLCELFRSAAVPAAGMCEVQCAGKVQTSVAGHDSAPGTGALRLCRTGSGGEFLEAELARGGEGIVAKAWEAPFGVNWIKCKRTQTWDLVVIEKDEARGTALVKSVNQRISESMSGEIAPTWVSCRREFDRIRVGEVIEVAAHSVHRSGKLREARFVRRRTDKA